MDTPKVQISDSDADAASVFQLVIDSQSQGTPSMKICWTCSVHLKLMYADTMVKVAAEAKLFGAFSSDPHRLLYFLIEIGDRFPSHDTVKQIPH
jgi:homoserine trans-succinylase